MSGVTARVLVALAALLVPRARRAAWRREWRGELDAARTQGRSTVGLALGALPDAWTMRTTYDGGTTMGGVWTGGWVEVRRAVRSLARAPGFSSAAVGTLAVGLGAMAAIFTLVDAILIRPLDLPAPDRVVRIYHTFEGGGGTNPLARFALPFFQEHQRTFDVIGAHWDPGDHTLVGDGAAERVRGVRATAELLDVLGATAVRGRLFDAADAVAEESSGVVVSHRLWEGRYGGDPDLVGRTIEIDGRRREVLGVMHPDVDLPTQRIDLWLPYAVPAAVRADDSFRLYPLARVREGVDFAAVEDDLTRMTARFPEQAGFYQMLLDEYGLATEIRPLRAEVVGDVEGPLWILLGAVAIVLAVAAGNVATLFLVRTEERRQEVAVRRALGADRGGILGHFLSESTVVAAAAGGLGLLLAAGAVRLFAALAPPDLPRLDDLSVGWATVGVAAALSALLALVLGLYPALRFGRGDAGGLGSRITGQSRTQAAVGGGLVVAQVALALVLLSGSALLLRTLQSLRSVDPGFEAAGVLVGEFALPAPSYPSTAEVQDFQARLLEAVAALPGVRQAALGPSPVGQRGCNGLYVEGRLVAEGEMPPCVPVVFVGPGYFELLGMDVAEGRALGESDDRTGAVPVGVVSANVASRVWPAGGALGAGVHPSPRQGPPWYRIEGIVEPVRDRGPDQPAGEALYLPFSAMEELGWLQRTSTLLVKTDPGREVDLAAPLRTLLTELDPAVPLTVQGSLESLQARTMRRSTFTLFLLGTAAGTTLILGLVGLYGVVAYRVGTRRAEIGLRMAMGARGVQVRRMVLGRSMRLVALGTVLGLAASVLATRVLSSLLFGVEPGDPQALAGAALTLVATAALACWIPALRASRVDPATALRGEG